MSEHYMLNLQFDSDDPEFARGVEVGLLYMGAEFAIFTGASKFIRSIHAADALMAMRIAEHFGMMFSAKELGDDWMQITFTPPTENRDTK